MKMKKKLAYLAVLLAISQTGFAQSSTTIINNYNTPTPTQPIQPNCNANQNDIYDPRIPPAGVYTTKNPDGSSSKTYTTGEKKPYIVNNNCGNNTLQPVPQVYPSESAHDRGSR